MDSPALDKYLPNNWLHAGRLLRGVAHDVNNRLGAMLVYSELIAHAPGASADTAAMAKEIAAAVRNSATLLDTVAALVSEDAETVETIHLNDALVCVSDLFRFELERGGGGVDLQLPREDFVIEGVRVRIVRAMAHGLRFAAESIPGAPGPRRLRIRLLAHAAGSAIEIECCAAPEELPAALLEAREHLRYHHGELTWVAPDCLRITFPKDTGLAKPAAEG